MQRDVSFRWLTTWVLAALALLVPLACSPALGDSFELPKLFLLKVGLAMALLTVACGGTVDTRVTRAPAALAAFLFLGLNALATLGSVEPRTALLGSYQHDQGLLTLAVQLGYFFLAASWVTTEPALARLAAGFTLSATLTSLYAIAQQVGLDPLGWPAQIEDGRRIHGTLGHPNSLGEFLALTMPLTAWLAWRGRGLRRDLPLWSLVAQLSALVVSEARAAWLVVLLQALIVGPLVIFLRCRPGRWLGPLLALAPYAVALTAFIALLLAPAMAGQVDAAVGKVVERGQPLKTRQYLWHSALAMVADRPLLGWGPDTFELAYPAYRSAGLDEHYGLVGRDDAVHNALLGVAVSAGLLGLAAYLGVQLAILLMLLRGSFGAAGASISGLRGAALALLLVWTSYWLLFMVGEPRVTTSWLAWVVAGSALGVFAPQRASPSRLSGVPRLALVLLALGLLTEAVSGVAADAAYARALDSRQREAPRAAVVWLQRAVALRPLEPVYQQELGLSLARLARANNDAALFGAAVDRLGRASALSSDRDAYLLDQLAGTLLEWQAATGQLTEAPLRYAQLAIALDPLNPLLHAEAADLAARLNRPAEARVYWDAARMGSRSPDALQRLGEVALRLGDPMAARTAFREAAGRQWRPALQAAHYRAWGEAALAAGLPDEAVLAFDEALARGPDRLHVHLKRAEALAASGRRQEALTEAWRALQRAPADGRAAALVEQLSHP